MSIVERIKGGYVPDKSNKQEHYAYLYLQDEVPHVDASGSDVVNFLKDKVILITGATGFLGKLLVEKLLRSCSDIHTIYLMVRSKKGLDFEERLDKILNDEVFFKLKESYPNFKEKIVAINGDMGLPYMGLSKGDRRMIAEQVNLIYHGAATTRFNEHIRKATTINVKGTQEILKLACECVQLVSFVHIGTAYSNCNKMTIEEKFYEPIMSAEKLYSITDAYSDEKLEEMTPELLGGLPNTYTFTKNISENFVKTIGKDLPICLFRPSIVIGAYKEPIKGWTDNVYGPGGALLAGGLGVMHTICIDQRCIADLVPVDYVVNACIVASYKTGTQERKPGQLPRVYNFVSGERNPLTWEKFAYYLSHEGMNVVTSKAVWYPFTICIKNYVYFQVVFFLLHVFPACLVDLGLAIAGKKTMAVSACSKLYTYLLVIKFFATKQWRIADNNVKELYDFLSEKDKKNFQFDIKDVDWCLCLVYSCYGGRIYLAKDPLSTLEAGWKKRDRLKILHVIVKWLLIILGVRYVYLFSKLFYMLLF